MTETRYEITTEASTRSKSRRTMHHTITAANEADARYEARMAHIARCGWNCSIWVSKVESK
ncbi:MAG: hypothetical protein LC798_02965 [Chloroflexi bacterium]|nr:hypothetical protein [Chloroflexota bacterium]